MRIAILSAIVFLYGTGLAMGASLIVQPKNDDIICHDLMNTKPLKSEPVFCHDLLIRTPAGWNKGYKFPEKEIGPKPLETDIDRFDTRKGPTLPHVILTGDVARIGGF